MQFWYGAQISSLDLGLILLWPASRVRVGASAHPYDFFCGAVNDWLILALGAFRSVRWRTNGTLFIP